MDPELKGITLIEDDVDETATFLLGVYARKFTKRSYKIICVTDSSLTQEFLEKVVGVHSDIRTFRIEDSLGWDSGIQTSGLTLHVVDNIKRALQQASIGDDWQDRKVALLLPCLSSIWSTLGHVETMRLLVDLYSYPKDNTAKSNGGTIAVVATLPGRLLTPTQVDQLRHITTLWVVPVVESANGNLKKDVTLCRMRLKYSQRKGAKITEKVSIVDITKAFDMVSASTSDHLNTKIVDKPTLNSEPDPTADLTFNLKLKDTETKAKQNVQLPHLIVRDRIKKQIGGDEKSASASSGGQVYYTPDEADDFDDEDPDADLDI